MSDPGQRILPPRPGQPLCRFCETPLDPHQAARGGICGAHRCEMRRVQEASRAVFQRDWDSYVGRQRRAVEAAAPDIARAAARLRDDPDTLAIGVVPHLDRPLVSLPQSRLDEFTAHLDEIIDKAFAEGAPDLDLSEREGEERPEEPLIDATCATCQGKCCVLGGPSHAFLSATTIQQYRARNPAAGKTGIRAHYLGRLPDRSVEHSCVYHGPKGCVLDRSERADMCNRYHCNPQTQLLKTFREMGADKAIIVANEDNAGPAVATYDRAEGWRALSADPDLEAFAQNPDPDPDLMQRAVAAAMGQIPPDLPARGSSVRRDAPVCKWCGAPVDAHQAATTHSCGGQVCEQKRMAETSEKVAQQKHARHMALQERVKAAFSAELAAAAQALGTAPAEMLVGVVPYQNKPVEPLDPERRAAFAAHLEAIAAEGFAIEDPGEYHSPQNRLKLDAPESAIADAGCATCQGGCCALGGPSMAFLDKWDVCRYRMTVADPTPAGFVDRCLSYLPARSVRNACVYQSATGCTVPRDERAVICNTFQCKGLKVLEEGWKAGPHDRAALVAHQDGEPRALGIFDAENGWSRLVEGPAESG